HDVRGQRERGDGNEERSCCPPRAGDQRYQGAAGQRYAQSGPGATGQRRQVPEGRVRLRVGEQAEGGVAPEPASGRDELGRDDQERQSPERGTYATDSRDG